MLYPILEPKINFFLQPIVIDVAAIAIWTELFITWVCRYSFAVILAIYRLDDPKAFLPLFSSRGVIVPLVPLDCKKQGDGYANTASCFVRIQKPFLIF